MTSPLIVTFFHNLPAHALPAPFSSVQMPSFALDLKPTAGSDDSSASIEFGGGIDHSKYVGELAKAPLNATAGHWAVDDVDFSVGDVRLHSGAQIILGAYFFVYPFDGEKTLVRFIHAIHLDKPNVT